MRILHVVTLVSPEGEIGGPLRVAVTQLQEMQRQGHEVLLVAAGRGFGDRFPDEYLGVPVKLFPAVQAVPGTGFAGLSAPAMAPWLLANARSFDAVHLHFARDLVLVPAAAALLARRVPFIAQTHGMVVPSGKRLAKILDAAIVRRVLRTARTTYALVPKEQEELALVEPRGRYEVLPNGMDVTADAPQADVRSARDVLFLARLAPRKRPADFAEAAAILAADFPEWTFSLVGPDEGEAGAVEAIRGRHRELGDRLRWEGPLEPSKTMARMAQSAVYVLPAENEPFGMTVIEAQRVGLPVVIRSDCGLAEGILAADAGRVYEAGVEQLVAELRTLMSSADEREALGARGAEYVEKVFGIDRVVSRLLAAYRGL